MVAATPCPPYPEAMGKARPRQRRRNNHLLQILQRPLLHGQHRVVHFRVVRIEPLGNKPSVARELRDRASGHWDHAAASPPRCAASRTSRRLGMTSLIRLLLPEIQITDAVLRLGKSTSWSSALLARTRLPISAFTERLHTHADQRQAAAQSPAQCGTRTSPGHRWTGWSCRCTARAHQMPVTEAPHWPRRGSAWTRSGAMAPQTSARRWR